MRKAFKFNGFSGFKKFNQIFLLLKFHSGQDKLPRSSSIDSMVDMVWNNDNDSSLVTLPKHLMVQETSNRRESLLSPRRTKQSRGINCEMIGKDGIYFMLRNISDCPRFD